LKPNEDELLSNIALNFNLCRYSVVLLAACAVGAGGLRSALGTETSSIALQSKMFQHFAQPLATAAAATAHLDDAAEVGRCRLTL
jgi:hypothetical protein